jgi:hypothetical protein
VTAWRFFLPCRLFWFSSGNSKRRFYNENLPMLPFMVIFAATNACPQEETGIRPAPDVHLIAIAGSYVRDMVNHPVFNGFADMIDEINNRKKIFYDFYTVAQKRANPAKEHTGLFFFREK